MRRPQHLVLLLALAAALGSAAPRGQQSAPVAGMVRLRQKLGSRTVEAHVLERSWHVITLDYDREEVGRLTADFLDRVERNEAA